MNHGLTVDLLYSCMAFAMFCRYTGQYIFYVPFYKDNQHASSLTWWSTLTCNDMTILPIKLRLTKLTKQAIDGKGIASNGIIICLTTLFEALVFLTLHFSFLSTLLRLECEQMFKWRIYIANHHTGRR